MLIGDCMNLIKLELTGTIRKEIVSTGKRMPWIHAHQLMQSKGSLPENKDFHRDLITRNIPYEELILEVNRPRPDFPHNVWLREIAICPKLGSYFDHGEDTNIIDAGGKLAVIDLDEHIALSEYTGRLHKNTILLVTEIKEIGYEDGLGIIVPAKIIPVRDVARYSHGREVIKGKIVDPEGDCIPRILSPEEGAKISEDEKFYFVTSDQVEVRSLVRCINDERQVIHTADYLGVAHPGYNRKVFDVNSNGKENLSIRIRSLDSLDEEIRK